MNNTDNKNEHISDQFYDNLQKINKAYKKACIRNIICIIIDILFTIFIIYLVFTY